MNERSSSKFFYKGNEWVAQRRIPIFFDILLSVGSQILFYCLVQ